MIKGTLTLAIPKPHRKEIGIAILTRILRQARINKDAREKL